MSDYCNIKKWDSDFFGYKVGEAAQNSLWIDSAEKLKDLYNQNFNLIVFNSTRPGFEETSNDYYHIKNVYTRIPLIKQIKLSRTLHPNISKYNSEMPTRELIELAKLSGMQGRFAKDSNFSKEQYDAIFEQWIVNSVKRKAADEVLVYKVDGRIIGFGTISINGEYGFAPLFAVNRDFEGKGISFALMNAIETVLVNNNCKYLHSGTQANNKKALAAFKRFGMNLGPSENIYHLWKK